MEEMKFNSEEIYITSECLRKINNDISAKFYVVETQMADMFENWKGEASKNASEKFEKIKSSAKTGRYEVMDGLIRFMQGALISDTLKTEATNSKLSDLFL